VTALVAAGHLPEALLSYRVEGKPLVPQRSVL
jgi:hypothetical protein